MNPHSAYREQRRQHLTRIDLILKVHEEAIQRLERASAALEQGALDKARPLLAQAQIIVCSFTGGLTADQGTLSANLLRLFEFVSHSIRTHDREQIAAGLQVLRTLQEAFQTIRPEALQLERSGTIPPLDTVHLVETRA
jgi:flagellin-specific chaperone FliS